ncbi:MAG: hypothetical protein RLZZ501_1934, partial [Pseudomonadota bacterium]
DRAYWLGRLDALPGPPDLPRADPSHDGKPGTDAAGAAARFERLTWRLPPASWQALTRTARTRQVTPSAAVLAAFAAIIGRWSRRPDFCLALTVLSRPGLHPDIDRVVGDFTSVSLLAVTPAATDGFAAQASALQARLWEDLDHGAFSGVEVLRELGRREDRRGQIMPVVFTSTLGLGGTAADDGAFMTGARLTYGISQTPQVWLDCQVAERGGALLVNWDLRQGTFPAGLAEAAFAAFTALLETLAADPAVWDQTDPVRLPTAMLARRERANATAAPLPDGLLQDGFLATARHRPDAVARIAGDQALTYAALAARAEAVRAALAEAGCRPGDRVAVGQAKGAEQIAAVLGTLMAGAAYLPLDPALPPARRDLIVADAGVRLALTGAEETTPWPAGVTPIRPDHLAIPASLVPGGAAPVAPSGLAYILYTSGTTGQPKGVMISHRAALNTIADINARFAVGPNDRGLGLAALGFDLSVYDIFGLFAAGGTLVLPDPARRGDPSHWAALIAAHRVTLWNSVPAQMQMLLDYLESAPGAALPSLRLALLSGDWIPVSLPEAARARWPGLRVVSLGGATEAAIWSIWHDIDAVPAGASRIPYGLPLTNQRVLVLNSRLAPCPDWTVGELYIGGAGLAEGYLGDPERTAERFPRHPTSGGRLYRTGDLGRARPDGVIEFLGREDGQVKIRGHRIELGEIEAVLQTHPGVAAVAAAVGGDRPFERHLAAFVVPARQEAAPRPGDDALASTPRAAGAAATAGLDRVAFAAWVAQADRIALLDILATLRGAGLFQPPHAEPDLDTVLKRSGAAPRHHRLVRRWLKALCAEGWLGLDPASGRYRLEAAAPGTDQTEQDWQTLRALERQVGYGAELLRYLRESAAHLPELLRGDLDPLDLLFPRGRLDTAFAAYSNNLVNRCLNRVVCAAARAVAATREPEAAARPLRVLEIGAGVGGTSCELIPALAGHPTDYLFTDLSPFFLNAARERHAATPWVRYGLYDLNEPAGPQGVPAGHWDLIVCANVLHNARNVPATLARLRELAAP